MNRVIWLVTSVLFVLMLILISSIEPRFSIPKITAPNSAINSGNEAYSKGDYLGAQEVYREAIQAGLGTNEIWMNYDKSLLMKTFKSLETDLKIFQPSHSIRQEQRFEIQPVNSKPNPNIMTEEEWLKMKEEVYEWLGC